MLATLLLSAAIGSLALTLACFGCVVRKLQLSRPRPRPWGLDGSVSILKPIKGADEGLYENLRSLVDQDYPEFEMIVCADDPADPAWEVVQRLRAECPDARIRSVAGVAALGLNPKVNSLAAMARVARYPTLLISDSNVRVPPDYLAQMMAELRQNRVGMVANLLVGVGERSVGALLENLHLNAFVISAISAADVIAGHPCVVGKSILLRRDALDAVGGWVRVRNLLAEDYCLGALFHRGGYRVVISNYLVPTYNADRSVAEFVARHVRWSQMRFRISALSYLGEAALNPTLWWVLALMAGQRFELVAAAIATKLIAEAELSRRLRGRRLGPGKALVIPIKDLLVFAIWMYAMVRRTVCWRGHRWRVGAGGELHALSEPKAAVAEPSP